MYFDELTSSAAGYLLSSPMNFVSPEDAIREELAGMQIYESPLFGVGSAADLLFAGLASDGALKGARLPSGWVDGAKSVISFFLPFTETVKSSNRGQGGISGEWLHARIEGQAMVNSLGAFICKHLADHGYKAAYPAADSGFAMLAPFASNWSERHVAYICGLGTFGLSKGIITEKGMAGRLGSVVTDAPLPVTPRPYSDLYEYCIMCGQCQTNCPADAIDIKKGAALGKDHALCSAFLDSTRDTSGTRPRYGCGKCQVGVPCESGIPSAR